MCYVYWENFIRAWDAGTSSILGWSDPNSIPLMNNVSAGTRANAYIPEPWWGNDGSQEIHSVIINYNPGQGGIVQMKPTPFRNSYALDIVNAKAFPRTVQWHEKKRALPILDSLCRLHYIKKGYSLQNHLSIELIPWHTSGTSVDGYWKYVENNIQPIYEHVICFAADQARRVSNTKLKSKVLVRMSANSFDKIASLLNKAGIHTNCINSGVVVGNAKYAEYAIAQLPDVRFYPIWGTKLRNNLPSAADLDNILRQL